MMIHKLENSDSFVFFFSSTLNISFITFPNKPLFSFLFSFKT